MDVEQFYLRVLTDADAPAFQEIRLRALLEHPDAFGATYEDEAARSLAEMAERFRTQWAAPDNFIPGALNGDRLVGTAGLFRQQNRKRQHKAVIWGVYVVPEARGHRLGRLLMEEVLRRARRLPLLERVELSVASTNPAARMLYLALGFQPWGVEPHALRLPDRYVDLEHMNLWLEEQP